MSGSVKLSFQFSNSFPTSDDRVPLFLRSAGVGGTLKVQGGDGKIDTIKLILKGKVTNIFNDGPANLGVVGSVMVQQTPLNLVDVHDASLGLPTIDGASRQYDFDFRFPKSCHDRKFDDLPPSVRSCSPSLPSSLDVGSQASKADWKVDHTASCRVNYELQAWTFHEDVVQAAISQDIRLYDSACVAQPPTITDDFPEFVMQQEKKITKGMMKYAGKVAITVAEPTPAEIRSDGGLVQTNLPVKLEISDRKGLPSRLELRVKSTLHGSTLIASQKMERLLSSQELMKSATVREVKTKAGTFTQTLNIPCHWQSDGSGTFRQDVSIPLPLVGNQSPPPTFMSAVVSRRYTVAVRIDVAGATFNLKVPVQIMYPRTEVGELPPSFESDLNEIRVQETTNALDRYILQSRPPSEPLPIYVR